MWVARLADTGDHKDQSNDPYGYVHPEHRRPGEQLDQDAADNRAGTEPQPGSSSPDSDGGSATLRWVSISQDRQAEGCDESGTDALRSASSDERRLVRREGARGRHRGEDRQPDDEHALAAVPVSQGPANHDERGEGEDVRIDDPDQVARLDVELTLDRRQGNVHDRVVEQNHALRDAHRDERHNPTSATERLPTHMSSVTGAETGVKQHDGRNGRCSGSDFLQMTAFCAGAAYHQLRRKANLLMIVRFVVIDRRNFIKKQFSRTISNS